MSQSITVEVSVNIPREKAWEFFTKPEHITQWNNASPDWECPRAGSDLKVGGTFSYRMQAKDGSGGFDFGGTYTEVVPNERIAYKIGDGRNVSVTFETKDGVTHVIESFETEKMNPIELQRSGWQMILNNYKKYAERR
jgi:uncharacterized protein YndB with AHSA1/START domain